MYITSEHIFQLARKAEDAESEIQFTESIEQLRRLQSDCMKHVQLANRLEYFSHDELDSDDDRCNRLVEFIAGIGVLIGSEVDRLIEMRGLQNIRKVA